MNERNVEALKAILAAEGYPRDLGGDRINRRRELAALLAARGVLAPSALTDLDEHALIVAVNVEERLPALLERIAKGEAA